MVTEERRRRRWRRGSRARERRLREVCWGSQLAVDACLTVSARATWYLPVRWRGVLGHPGTRRSEGGARLEDSRGTVCLRVLRLSRQWPSSPEYQKMSTSTRTKSIRVPVVHCSCERRVVDSSTKHDILREPRDPGTSSIVSWRRTR